MRKFFTKRVVGIALLVLIALFVIRPRVGLLHRKVRDSLSMQLGRAVEMSAVHIRFLPRPGLEIENLTIHDGADFDAEPLLRSSDVIAFLRVSSLFRRRFEISGLSFSDASLNLSRDVQGKWNIEELLERAAKSSTAPTGSNRKEARREFPYIEADKVRINFKNGLEKTHFALTGAQFSLWQESEDQWGLRLRANPIRTDANLTDTGLISVSGIWRRSAVLANTPVHFSFEWKQAQLGQVSKLFSGADKGWRGNVLLSGTLAGTLGNSTIVADATVDQLRRQDILVPGDLHLATHCSADYNASQVSIINLDCGVPAGDGSIELKGSATGVPFSAYDLTLVSKDASAQFAFDLARHMNASVPQDLAAVGGINLALSVNQASPAAATSFSGTGEALGLRLSSSRTGNELQLGTVPLRFVSSVQSRSKRSQTPSFVQLQIGPFNLPSGRAAPLLAELSVSRAGYYGYIRGDATLKRLQQAADVLHVPMPTFSADGNATVELALSHNWGEGTPAITGTAQLHSVRAEVRGLNAPLLIHRADLSIGADSVKVTGLDGSARETSWRGSLSLPRPCSLPDSCTFEFNLHSPQLSAATLNQLFNPADAKRPWYRLLGLSASNSFFSKASASGTVAVDKLTLGNTVCIHFSAELALNKAKLSLARIHGNVFGGKSTGSLTADFSVRPPAYSGAGTFDGVSLAMIAALTHTEWADGSGSANYQFKTVGWKIPELLDSADLTAAFRLKDSVFPHIVLAEGGEPLHANAVSGQIILHNRAFAFEKTELRNDEGIFTIKGTATVAGALNLKLMSDNSSGYTIAGTLDQTRVSPIRNAATQAELKP